MGTTQYNTTQYNTTQYNTTQYNTNQYNTIQYNTIQYNTIQYNTTQHNTIQYNTTQDNTIQYNTIQYNTIQYNTIQCNTIQYNTIQSTSSIIDQAKVKPEYLPKSKANKPIFPSNKLLENLNTIILSQYLIKTNMALSKSDIVEIQATDPYLYDIIKKIENQDDKLQEKFVIQDKILFVVMTVLGETVLRLCLPTNMCNHILTNLHENNRCHVTANNLLDQFNANFWSKGSNKMAKQVMEKCLHCRLNTSRRKMMVKGNQREFQKDETPGRVWTADLLYLPRSSEGFRFCLVLSERLTSYICGLPLKTLDVKHVAISFAQFLSIMPPMEVLYTDLGRYN